MTLTLPNIVFCLCLHDVNEMTVIPCVTSFSDDKRLWPCHCPFHRANRIVGWVCLITFTLQNIGFVQHIGKKANHIKSTLSVTPSTSVARIKLTCVTTTIGIWISNNRFIILYHNHNVSWHQPLPSSCVTIMKMTGVIAPKCYGAASCHPSTISSLPSTICKSS